MEPAETARFVNEHPALVAKCPDEFTEDHWFMQGIFGDVVRR